MNRLAKLNIEPAVVAQLDAQETPLRIQSERKTYYVLTVEQIAALMQPLSTVEDNETFAPEDFGLTEAEVTEYLARREERERQVGAAGHKPLEPSLKSRLDMLQTMSDLFPASAPADEQTVEALEAAMMHNLQVSIDNAS